MRRYTACPPTHWLALFALLAACASNPTPRCATSTDCAPGDVCYRGFCIAGQPLAMDGGPPPMMMDAAMTCPFGQTACAMDCVNLLSDRDHCGACDTRCRGMAGTCTFAHCVVGP